MDPMNEPNEPPVPPADRLTRYLCVLQFPFLQTEDLARVKSCLPPGTFTYIALRDDLTVLCECVLPAGHTAVVRDEIAEKLATANLLTTDEFANPATIEFIHCSPLGLKYDLRSLGPDAEGKPRGIHVLPHIGNRVWDVDKLRRVLDTAAEGIDAERRAGAWKKEPYQGVHDTFGAAEPVVAELPAPRPSAALQKAITRMMASATPALREYWEIRVSVDSSDDDVKDALMRVFLPTHSIECKAFSSVEIARYWLDQYFDQEGGTAEVLTRYREVLTWDEPVPDHHGVGPIIHSIEPTGATELHRADDAYTLFIAMARRRGTPTCLGTKQRFQWAAPEALPAGEVRFNILRREINWFRPNRGQALGEEVRDGEG